MAPQKNPVSCSNFRPQFGQWSLVLLKPNLDRVGLVAAFNVIGLSLPGLLSHGGGVSTHQWAVVSGLAHGIAIALWISGVAAIFLIVSTSQFTQDQKSLALHKFGYLAGAAVIALIISGEINAYTRFNNFSECKEYFSIY